MDSKRVLTKKTNISRRLFQYRSIEFLINVKLLELGTFLPVAHGKAEIHLCARMLISSHGRRIT